MKKNLTLSPPKKKLQIVQRRTPEPPRLKENDIIEHISQLDTRRYSNRLIRYRSKKQENLTRLKRLKVDKTNFLSVPPLSKLQDSEANTNPTILDNDYSIDNSFDDSFTYIPKTNLMKPIHDKEKEYEAEIVQFLGKLKEPPKLLEIPRTRTEASPLLMAKKEASQKIKTSITPPPITKVVTSTPSPQPTEKIKAKRQAYRKKRSKSSMDFRNKIKNKSSWVEDLVKIDKEELKLKRTIKQLNNKCKMIIEKRKHRITPPPNVTTDKKQDSLDKSILNISRTIRNLSNKCQIKFDKLSHIIKSPKHNIVRLRK